MYSIYADGLCIYNDTYDSQEYLLESPVLKMSDSAAGSLEFTMPPANVGYNSLVRMQTEIVVKRNDKEIWSGRVLKEDSDFWNNKKVLCEGELAYLNDSTQPQAEYHSTIRGFLTSLITRHNNKVGDDKKFTVGAVTVTDNNDSIYRYTNYEHTLDAINDKLVSRLGGHLRVRKVNGVRYLDYLADYPKVSSQKINFGENLLDFTRSFDMSGYATVVLPRGAQLEDSPIDALPAYLTVESVNGGSPYVFSRQAVDTYGWIETVVDWDDVTEPENLLRKAKQYLSEIQFDDMSIELTALDLHYLDVNAEAFDLLDEVDCVSEPHGLNRRFPLVEIDIPMNHPEDTKYKLGTSVEVSLTAASKIANEAILRRINSFPTRESVLKEAKANATEIMNMATNGYVTTVVKNGHAEELIISDNPDYTQAQKLWRWNLNGFGYSKQGYEGEFGLAITMDGAIVADFITAGTLNADIVRAGILQDKLGYNYWDLDTGEFSLSPNTSIGESTIQQYISQSSEAAVAQAEQYADEQVAIIQRQVDGAIESYYYNYQPKNNNQPASTWTTEAEKAKHEGDIFYWKDRGYAYRWMPKDDGTGWEWRLIQDTDITNAIAAANQAVTTANSKIKTFAQPSKPTGALSVGDLWIDTKNKNLLYRWNGSSWVNVRDQLTVDAMNAASAAQKAAAQAKNEITATKKLVDELESEYGHNILRGTNDTTTLTTSGEWRLGLWRSASGGKGTRTSFTTNSAPQENIYRCWRLANTSSTTNKSTDIAQDNIKGIAPGKKYTLSCYAKGTGQLLLQYGKSRWASKKYTLNNVKAWTRYKWTFTADGSKDANNKYLVQNETTNVYIGNRANGTLEVCALQLELGSEVHDYYVSSEEGAIKALKESMTQQEIFNRLTNNGEVQGIKLSGGKIYINASYINSGTLSAGYVKTGVITDKKKLSVWNLDSGVMNLKLNKLEIKSGNSYINVTPSSFRVQSTNLSWKSTNSSMSDTGILNCKGAVVRGTLEAGDYNGGSYIKVSDGRINAFYKKTDLGFIGAHDWYNDNNYRGLIFELKRAGSYMAWGYENAQKTNFIVKWLYAAKSKSGSYKADTLYAGCDIDLKDNKLLNIGNGKDLGRVCIPSSMNYDGTVNSWYEVSVKDGLIQ